MSYLLARRIPTAIAVFLLLVTVGASTLVEPESNGKTLSELLELSRGTGRAVVGKGSDMLFAEEPDKSVQQVRAIQEIRTIGTNALPVLFEWLRTDRFHDALAGFEALNNIAAPAIPQLVRMVEGEDARTRDKALLALGKIGPSARIASPVLVREVGRENVSAIIAAGLVRLNDPSVVAELSRQLDAKKIEGEGIWAQEQIVVALGNIGPGASRATVALIEFLDATGAVLQNGAGGFRTALLCQKTIEALGKIGDERVVGTLNRMLLSRRNPGNLTSVALRRTLMRTLGDFGPAARESLPILLEISASPHTELRDKAIAVEAIMRIEMQAL